LRAGIVSLIAAWQKAGPYVPPEADVHAPVLSKDLPS